MRFLIKFSYDGSNYGGFQTQPNMKTVQEELEKALTKVNNGNKTSITATGRTDKGVHALCQYGHADLNIEITEYKLKRALNSNLPEDIHVISTKIVPDNFHARYYVKKKEYKYYMNLGEYNPIMRNYEYQYGRVLDVLKMMEAIHVFEGTHDFTSFVSSEDIREDKVRTIYKTSIKRNKDVLTISFQANGFMKYQVRNMVGILIEVGSGKKEVQDVERTLNLRNRETSIKIAPAEGLYLRKVCYS